MHYLWAQDRLKLKWMYFDNEVQKSFFIKKDDHLPQTVGNIYLRKGAKIMLYKKKMVILKSRDTSSFKFS